MERDVDDDRGSVVEAAEELCARKQPERVVRLDNMRSSSLQYAAKKKAA